MKIIILFSFFSMLHLFGCGLASSQYAIRDYKAGDIREANVGEAIITSEAGTKNPVYNYVKEGTKKELIYGGKDGDVIHIQYREYYINRGGTFIKDGFSQDLRYDISESSIITYQSLKMEIIEATSSKLVVKILDTAEERATPDSEDK